MLSECSFATEAVYPLKPLVAQGHGLAILTSLGTFCSRKAGFLYAFFDGELNLTTIDF